MAFGKQTFGKPTYHPDWIEGPLRYILGVLFLVFAFALICVDFYLFEQALIWVDPEIVGVSAPPPPVFKTFKLGKRNLFNALLEEKVTRQEANAIIAGLKENGFDFTSLRPRQRITLKLDNQGRPIQFTYELDAIHTFVAQRLSDGTFDTEKKELPTVRETVTIAGRVKSSVWQAIVELGEKPTMTAKFIEIFGWDIDFSSDTQRGDSFVMILEKIYAESGEFIGYGKLFAGQYNGQTVGKKRGFYVDHPDPKKKGFFTEQGMQMRKFMLRAPLDTLRVTSRFGFRMHPTLGRRKQHNGIDYGAPSGTPIWAVADGKVLKAGMAGAAGNMVVIDHGNGLASYYMHMSRINCRAGQNVSQRKLIGRVGSTGRSTGPHLHFGLKYKGHWVDPRKRDFGKPIKLAQEHMPLLNQSIEKWGETLELAEKGLPPLPAESAQQSSQEAEQPFATNELE